MPLFLLGVVFIVGVGLYYYMDKYSNEQDEKFDSEIKAKNKSSKNGGASQDNVIYLPADIEKAKKKHIHKK